MYPQTQLLLDPEGFLWDPSTTPLSSPVALGVASTGYLVLVISSSWIIQKPVPLPRFIAAAHNLFLCLLSLVMVVGTVLAIPQTSRQLGSNQWLFCLPADIKIKGPIFYWSYIYYLSKYWEFIDTLLLVLKAKPLSFLHVFHHAVVPTMAFLWLNNAQSLQHIALLTNAGVHVIMYLYYFLCSIGIYPKWKQLITQCQIVQFVFSFLTLFPFAYYSWKGHRCAGSDALLFNAAFNFLLLLLFIQFSAKTYRSKQRKAA